MHWFGFRSVVNPKPISKMYGMRLYDETFAGTSHNLNLIADNEIVSAMANGTVEWVMQSAIIIISIRSLGTRDTFHTTHTHIGHQKTAARQAFAFCKMIMWDNWINIWLEVYLFGLMVLFYARFLTLYRNTRTLKFTHTCTHAQTHACIESERHTYRRKWLLVPAFRTHHRR